jgi:hypothetical protein
MTTAQLPAFALLIAGAFVMWQAIDIISSHNRLRKRGISTNALILEAVLQTVGAGRKKRQFYWFSIRFHDLSKQAHTLSFTTLSTTNSRYYLVGESLSITYDPATPAVFEETTLIYSRQKHKKLLIGLLLILTGFWLL